jgi:hypothetical protein
MRKRPGSGPSGLTTSERRPRLGGGAAVSLAVALLVVAGAREAAAHWTIASTLGGADAARTFSLVLHYEVLAGQPNPDEPLRVCFWIEGYREGRYTPLTRESCQRLTLKATEWRTLAYSADQLAWHDAPAAGRLAPGQYRAVALIESDVGFVTRILWGAPQERKWLPFVIPPP